MITTAHAHKRGVIFHIFPPAFKQKKKNKALRPKMTKIASRGGGSCLKFATVAALFRIFSRRRLLFCVQISIFFALPFSDADCHAVTAVQQYRQWAGLGFVRTAASTDSMRLSLSSQQWTELLMTMVARGLHQEHEIEQPPNSLVLQLQEQVSR